MNNLLSLVVTTSTAASVEWFDWRGVGDFPARCAFVTVSEIAVTERLENICRTVQNLFFCSVTAISRITAEGTGPA